MAIFQFLNIFYQFSFGFRYLQIFLHILWPYSSVFHDFTIFQYNSLQFQIISLQFQLQFKHFSGF